MSPVDRPVPVTGASPGTPRCPDRPFSPWYQALIGSSQNILFANARMPLTMLTLKPPPSQKGANVRRAGKIDWTGHGAAGWPSKGCARRCVARGGGGTPPGPRNPLKTLDSEKTMQGNERSFTDSRAFRGASAHLRAVLQIPLSRSSELWWTDFTSQPRDSEPMERDYNVRKLWLACDKDALLGAAAPEARAIAMRGELGASAALIDKCPKLEIIACYGVGVDAIDLMKARARRARHQHARRPDRRCRRLRLRPHPRPSPQARRRRRVCALGRLDRSSSTFLRIRGRRSRLIDALPQKRIGGACLDVFWNEPKIDRRLLDFDNVIVQPHQSSGTVETRKAKATEFTEVLFATLFMELRGGLEVGRHLVAKAGRGGGKLNALVRRFRLL